MNGNASTPQWIIYDGTGNTNIRDYDGTLTGLHDVQIVQDRPFFTEPGCLSKPDWGLALCRRNYFQLVVRGDTGVLEYSYRGQYPVTISKDKQPQDPYIQSGEKGHKFILVANESYTIRFNDSVGEPPRDILLRPRFGLQNNEVVRLALCLPKNTTQFKIKNDLMGVNTNTIQWVNSTAEVDADTTMKAYFWDQPNGYLYFKLSSPYALDDPDQRCPGNQCADVSIERVIGDNEPAVCESAVTPYIHPDSQSFEQLVEPGCNGTSSGAGLGAPIESGFVPPSSVGTCM
ncbi:transmembrane protein 2-like [Plakobranchus ocellatus]|uniref:Transmembrane protein 2-like n=1 Tax=Plakobranchus ocellatus TaxID=259542 RepID=A0AAV4AJA6_9GAST|nr:transmembrane protein 2-like [Plakobranchus ocellatus]